MTLSAKARGWVLLLMALCSVADSARGNAEAPLDVLRTTPTSGESHVSASQSLAFYFRRSIEPGPNWNGMSVTAVGGSESPSNPSLSTIIRDRLILRPNGLESGATYEAVLPAGAVVDSEGRFSEPFSLTFSVAEERSRLSIAVYPNLLIEGEESTVHVWVDRPFADDREISLVGDSAVIDMPTSPLTLPAGEVLITFPIIGREVDVDTGLSLQVTESSLGTAGVSLVVADVTPELGSPFRFNGWTKIDDEDHDGDFEVREDAVFQISACNVGTESLSNPMACLEIIDAESFEIWPLTPCKELGAPNPGHCVTRSFDLRTDFDVPPGQYHVRVLGTSSTNTFEGYGSFQLINEHPWDYDLDRTARGSTIHEPGEVVEQDYYADHHHDGFDAALPAVLFRVENEAGEIVLERLSYVDPRRESAQLYVLSFEAPEESGVYQVFGTINPPPSPIAETTFENNEAEPFSFRVNRRVFLDPLGGPYTVEAGETFSLPVTASDADGDVLAFRFEQSPIGMEIQPTGDQSALITWTPVLSQGPATYLVTVEAGDDFRHEAIESFELRVERRADLSLSWVGAPVVAVPGLPLALELETRNLGPAPEAGASIVSQTGPSWVQTSWSCIASPGSHCAAEGEGMLLDPSLALARHGVASYSVMGSTADDAAGTLELLACVQPDPPVIDVSPANNCAVVGVQLAALDFGDAPDASLGAQWRYPVRLAENGARHGVGSLRLGAAVDGEADGQPSPTGNGDDVSVADEDGVVLGVLFPGETFSVSVDASAEGLLSAWLDWNRDGDWLDPGEQVLSDVAVDGATDLESVVPADAIPGTSYARFRFSSQAGLSTRGVAADGEVEDHFIEISPPRPVAVGLEATVEPAEIPEPGGSAVVTIRVENRGEVAVEVAELTESIHGDLNGIGSCAVPQLLEPEAVYACAYEVDPSGNAGDTFSATVGTEARGPATIATAEASYLVTILDTLPEVDLLASVEPPRLTEPGGEVVVSLSIHNGSEREDLDIDSWADALAGSVDGLGDCQIPSPMLAGSTYHCEYPLTIDGSVGPPIRWQIEAVSSDDEGNQAFASTDLAVEIVAAAADLSVSSTNGRGLLQPGSGTTYWIEVENLGPLDVVGAVIEGSHPEALHSCQWSCVASQGDCSESGVGELEELFDLEIGGLLTYALDCRLDADFVGTLSHTVTVTVPSDLIDPQSANNAITDTTEVVEHLFYDGFESGDTSAWPMQDLRP